MTSKQGPQVEGQPLTAVGTTPWTERLARPFWSLRDRNFATYWTALSAHSWSQNMQMFIRSWYAFDLTDQAVVIGGVAVAQGLPIIVLSLFGGALADRLNNRTVMFAGFLISAVSTLVIAIVISAGLIQWWHLLISAGGSGMGMSLAAGARMSIVSELVPREHLLNAISLSNLANNFGRIAAPAIAGLILATALGIEGVYYLMTVMSFVAVAIVLLLPVPASRPKSRSQSVFRDMADGLNLVRKDSVILWRALLYMVTASFGMPFVFLLPVLGKEAWGSDPTAIGILFSMLGLGAVIGSLGTASIGDFRRKGLLLLVVSGGFGVGIVALSLSPVYWAAIIIMVPLGVFQASRLSLNATLVQLKAPEESRGRVMGIYDLGNGVFPFGVLAVSALADLIPSQYALAASGSLVLLFSAYVLLSKPWLRNLI